jgi:type II secretory pathway pseudopilin PulG
VRPFVSAAGFSSIELLATCAIAGILSAVAVPTILTSLDDARAAGAVRYVSARLQRARMDAVAANRTTAVRIASGAPYGMAVYADGNRNGVLSADIQAGVDRAVGRSERLPDHFHGVDFGALPGLPPVDPSSPAPGSDPIRLGSSDMASFTPLGTATSGSLYVLGRRGAQYAVRIFGATGRVRILKFNAQSQQWIAMSEV